MSRRPWVFLSGFFVALAVAAAPVRVSFLDTRAAREDTLRAFARAGCAPENIAALRNAMLHYYRTPLALDTSAFPPARGGFFEFDAIGDFISALGTNQLSFLDHGFELNCFHSALLLAAPDMDITADLQTRGEPYLAIQVSDNFNEWVLPVTSLGDVYAIAHPDNYESALGEICGLDISEKHKTLLAAFYQFHPLPLGTSSNTIAAETQAAFQRHLARCGLRFPSAVSLVLLHRARSDYHLAVTDHMGVLLKHKTGYLYLEKAGGKGPFLRLDVQDPADIAAYLSTGTWPDYPFNYLSINGTTFLPVPLKSRVAPFVLAPATHPPGE